MSEPNVRARALMQSSRDVTRPTDADRERIQKALRARLGVAALPLPAHGATHSTNLPWPFVSTMVMGAVFIGAALLFAFRQKPRALELARNVTVSTAISGSAAATLTPPAELASASGVEAAVPSERPPTLAQSAEDPLAQEVALLGRAVTDLHAGRLGEALKALDEHQRRFPNGALIEERHAARAQAFCSLGRRNEAYAEIAQLAPQSPASSRAKQICEAASRAGR